MLEELPKEYYDAVRRQDEDGDPLSLPLTNLEKEKRVYSKDVVEKFNRLPPQLKRGGIGKAVTNGHIRSATPFSVRPVVLKIGRRNVRLSVNPNDKTHPADQLGRQIERSGLFSPAEQENGYVELYVRAKGDQPRRQLSSLSWRDAFKEVTDNAVGPYNKAAHVSVTVDPALPKRPLRIGEDPSSAAATTSPSSSPSSSSPDQEEEDDEEASAPIKIETDGMASREDLLRAMVHEIAKMTAKTVISQHDEKNPDWRPTLSAVRTDPIIVRKIVVRSLHKAKPAAFPNADLYAALGKLNCPFPHGAINTFSTMLSDCLASEHCTPPPTLCNRRFVSCFNPCKLKRYLCEKIRCAFKTPIFAWVSDCARALRARTKSFFSCYKDCRENSCALRSAERCPDGAVEQDDCVQIKTICSSSDSGSSSDSDSDSDSERYQGLSSMDAIHMRQLRKQRRHLGRTKRRILRKFCPSCHQELKNCHCKRVRVRSVFCKREQPVSVFDALCPIPIGPYDCPIVPLCEPIRAEFDRTNWRRRAVTNVPTTPVGTYEAPTVAPSAPSASTQPSANHALQPGEVASNAVRRLDFDEEENNSDSGEEDFAEDWQDSDEDQGTFDSNRWKAAATGIPTLGEEEDIDGDVIEGKLTDAVKKKISKARTAVVSKVTGKKPPPKVHEEVISVVVVSDANPENRVSIVKVKTHRNPSEVNLGSPLARKFVLSKNEFSRLRKAQVVPDSHRAAEFTDVILSNASVFATDAEKNKLAAEIRKKQTDAEKKQSEESKRTIKAQFVGEEFGEEKEEEEESEDDDDDDGDEVVHVEDDDWVKDWERDLNDTVTKRTTEAKRKGERDDVFNTRAKRSKERVGDLMSDGFELNNVEHARYATAENDAEIHAALKSALDRTGNSDDKLLVQAIVDANRAQTERITKHVTSNYNSSELSDEEHIGWAFGRYWGARLNRRRAIAWNKFAEWYNKRSCTRKMCMLPVPPVPVKPDPCKPCAVAADPCGGVQGECKLKPGKSGSVSSLQSTKAFPPSEVKKEEKQQQQQTNVSSLGEKETQVTSATSSTEEGKKEESQPTEEPPSDEEEEELETDENNPEDEYEEIAQAAIRARIEIAKTRAARFSDIASSSKRSEDVSVRTKNSDATSAYQAKEEEPIGCEVHKLLDDLDQAYKNDDAGEIERLSKKLSDINDNDRRVNVGVWGDSYPNAASSKDADGEESSGEDEETEQAAIRARIETAKARAIQVSAPVSASASASTLAPHKFKVDNFVRVMKETGADSAYRNFTAPDVDAHIVMLHDDHPSQKRVLNALKRAQGNTDAQRKILAPLTVFVARKKDGTMQSMNNVKASARDNKTFYTFQRGSEIINGKSAGPPVDIRTGEHPSSFGSAVKLVYPVADFSH